MMEVNAKVLAVQKPANLKKAYNHDNEAVNQLTGKMHKLKFRLLDIQNKNQMLRKELKIANKVINKEMPSARDGHIRGHEEETVCLRHKISELQKQIEGRCDEGKITSHEDAKQRVKSSNLSTKQSPTEKLVDGCVEMKNKVEYWRNRNAELEKMSDQLRLEMDRLLDKSDDNRRIQQEYGGLERELRARQGEKLDMRCKLDNLKTRNCQLSEELNMLREDIDRIKNKTADDKMLLEALSDQQGNFQDLIERQRMLGESDHRHFRDDLREVQVKYKTSCDVLVQLEETTREKDCIIQELQDYKDLLTYAKEEIEETKRIPDQNLPEVVAEKIDNANDVGQGAEQGPSPPQDPELLETCERLVRHFESVQEEVEQLTDIAINNNIKLNEWRSQLREAKVAYSHKKAEICGLQQSVKTLENLSSSKPAKLNVDNQSTLCTMDELMIKLDIEKEVHQFMDNNWKTLAASTYGLFQIYATGADRITKMFIDNLKERKKSLEKRPSDVEVSSKASSSRAEIDHQSSSKASSTAL